MVHANGTAKRGAPQRILNDAVGVTKNKDGHEKTDYTRWRLKDDRGCQTWHYLQTDEEMKAWPQSTADKYFLGLDTVCLVPFLQPPWYSCTRVSTSQLTGVGTTKTQACKDTPRSCG